MFKRIDTTFIFVSDIKKSVKWYQEIMKLEIGLDYPGYVAFKLGETYLTLIENQDQINGKYASFNFYVEDAKKVHKYLKDNNVKVDELKHDGVDYFSFYDLDGNRLEVCSF
ncbi:VOC family protein [Haploplasma axanthum]|uniref:Fosfomycin resistance protein FosB n=1 Tax=Haploplasma axanthum TaxID=29552 RepID=A0A449BFG1_HAPAX|nr:VOC family protein [Haploplasma axanthum]VEU81176.1 fosfomycin resistance protein FosB [Haploplasma axanthum]